VRRASSHSRRFSRPYRVGFAGAYVSRRCFIALVQTISIYYVFGGMVTLMEEFY
jgi:hypothetical protein